MKNTDYTGFVIGLALLATAVSGCARVYVVRIDSINDNAVKQNKVYQIVPGNKDTGINDLQFKEYARLLVKAMSMQGYVLAGALQPAELEVYFSYGVGEPEKHTYSYSQPVWGQTGVEIYTQNQYNGRNTGTAQNYGTQYTAVYVEPQYGVTGYTSETAEYTVFKKYIILDAYDIKDGRPKAKLNEVWKTSIAATGRVEDLRKIFPALLAASVKYIGTNTGAEIAVEISEESPALKAFK